MSFDDPNREAVGQPPIWTGAEGTDTKPQPTATTSDVFDPGDHTVAEVQDYIAEHPDEEDAVLTAETAGKNRATLTGG